jgi:predicted  nucleic acid-binding Zn-ribbon protein
MEPKSSGDSRNLALLESVRCLDCGAVYAKPSRGGTAVANPGCPECGYVGWLAVTIPLGRGHEQFRPVAGRSRRRSAQSG